MEEKRFDSQTHLSPAQPLLKGSDIARRLNISRSSAYNLMRSGEILTVRIGRCLRVREEDLAQFILTNLYKKEENDNE